MRESTAAIVASVSHWNNMAAGSFLINNTFSTKQTSYTKRVLLLLYKLLSPYTEQISEWIAFALSPFAHRKRITESCSLWDLFISNVAVFDVYKWRHGDVVVIKLTAGIQYEIPCKTYIPNFSYFKRMMPFCNLFMERPSHVGEFCCQLKIYAHEMLE